MNIFDCHVHIEKGINNYDLEHVTHKNIIFNSIQSYKHFSESVSKNDIISLIFDVHNLNFVLEQAKENKIQALKIHSREQKLTSENYTFIEENLALFSDNLPVIIDAFYYGDDYKYQPSLEKIIDIARAYPNKKIIVAHSGGYEILKYFFHLRPLQNIYYDLSFSLQYLHDTSLYIDLKKLIHYTEKSKIMFGSDYHWASPKLQMTVLLKIFDDLNISVQDQELIVFKNAATLFKIR